MPEYCCRTGKVMGYIDCDRCHDRRAYNANICMGLKINEPGWTAPDGYTQDTDGLWKVRLKVKTDKSPAPPKVTTKTVVQYEYNGRLYKTVEEVKRSMLFDRFVAAGLFDGMSSSRTQNDEIRSYTAENVEAIVKITKEVYEALAGLADPPPSSEG